jgi:hypothetical protein
MSLGPLEPKHQLEVAPIMASKIITTEVHTVLSTHVAFDKKKKKKKEA